ncbi:MAG TPA: dihydroneopterin aldolase, partial [Myxococcota bacterium]|nr:dihydroneopterin aldolase [Myxococcota bacterium]
MRDAILLEGMTFDAVLGVTDAEQRGVQPVVIDLELRLDVSGAIGGDLGRSIDYAAVHEQVRTLVQYGHWRLIESLAVGIAHLVTAPPGPAERRAQVEEVRVTVRKPTILQRAVPGVRVARRVDEVDLQTRLLPPKTWVDTLVVTDLAGAYRVHVEPGTSWDVPPGAAVQVIAGAAHADGRPV